MGINSSVGIYFAIGFFVQFWLRKKHPEWFIKYNYLLAAAISGGTELLVFVTTFAVQGKLKYTNVDVTAPPRAVWPSAIDLLTPWFQHRCQREGCPISRLLGK